ncbi:MULTISPECIES: metal-dependent hydrolase [unclassified Haladaptatus]|uniref:metal-dependent hydrolase n=1 Tax=unclassified Haladaptatus TaxID=2622732 RepID=UPI00209C53B6|nr:MULTISPECIES: metal-dependent hydrolase [unclassified Haladaptatus]MCO8243331.1 metal-dependent hydrolase [Haladaptatus sp. AB643]MCO8253042.1 metal-dependent hydrolase [Haladaptatus sp. AB618]
MYQPGHCGVALALYAPVGGALVASGFTSTAFLGAGVVLALTMLPDLDTRTDRVRHRGPTHSIVFAAFVGLLTGFVGGLLAGTSGAEFGGLVGALAIVAHLLADVITPMGIRPFWPVSDRKFTFDIVLASNTRANALLFVFGVVFTGGSWFLGNQFG